MKRTLPRQRASASCRPNTPSGRCSPASRRRISRNSKCWSAAAARCASSARSPLAGYWEEDRYMPDGRRRTRDRTAARRRSAWPQHHRLRDRHGIAQAETHDARRSSPRGRGRRDAQPLQGGANCGSKASTNRPRPRCKNLMGYLRDNAATRSRTQQRQCSSPRRRATFDFKFMYLHGRKPNSISSDSRHREHQVEPANRRACCSSTPACDGFERGRRSTSRSAKLCKKLFPDRSSCSFRVDSDGKDDPLFRLAQRAAASTSRP